jgi:hypothetical protein
LAPRTDYQWAGARETVVASAARTTTGNSGSLTGYGPATTLRAQLDVTAVTGTNPTLDVLIQDTLDGTNWNNLTAGTFTQKTAVSREVVNITVPFSDELRVTWTIGGTDTPTFTFSVKWVAQ